MTEYRNPAPGEFNPPSKKRRFSVRLPRAVYEVLFVLFVLSIYTEVPLFLTDAIFVPSFITLLLIAPVLLLLFYNTVYKYEASFIGLVFVILLVTALASPGFEYIDEKALGLLQTMASIVTGVLLVKLISRLDRKRVAWILLALSLMLVAGAALEVVGLLRGASDAFRSMAYAEGGYEVYDSVARDAGITGFPRPNFFTSEPSLLAKGFFVFVNSWLLLAYTRKHYYVASTLTLLMFVLNGSPTLLFSLAVSATVAVYSERRFSGAVPVVLLLLFGSLASVYVAPEVFGNTVARFDTARDISLSDTYSLANDSIGLRLILPFIILADVLRESPFFGVGISGKEAIVAYSAAYLPTPGLSGDEDSATLGNNNIATLFIYMGLIGSSLFVATLLSYLRKLRVREISMLLLMIAVLALSMGGFEAPRFWGYVFLFVGVVKKRNEDHPIPGASPSLKALETQDLKERRP